MTEQGIFSTPPEGLVIELVTPLTASGELDTQGLERLVERVAPAADALLAGSPGVGEGLELPPDTRRRLLGRLLEILGGRLPLFFGITGPTGEETGKSALMVREEVARHKYPGPVFLVDLPLWYHSNRGLPQHYQRLLAEARLPLILLNLPEVVQRRAPVFKHLNLRTSVFKKLTARPEILGLIYQGDMGRFLNYHHAALARPNFAFYEGDESRFLTRPGAWGVISPGALLLPDTWRRVSRACLHPEELGDSPESRQEIWADSTRLLRLVELYRRGPASWLKAALAAQGVIQADATAAPSPPLPPPPKQKVLEFLADITD
ncbi:MAG: dihydrodipicolinate synthase family protein [Thermodesulfobacteriota bacterium]